MAALKYVIADPEFDKWARISEIEPENMRRRLLNVDEV